jgi:hypothetical protein
MWRPKVTTWIYLAIGLASLSLGVWLGVASDHSALGVIVGVLTCAGLVNAYDLLAMFFGWPKLPGSQGVCVTSLMDP